MSEFNVGDKYYLAGRGVCIWTLTSIVKYNDGEIEIAHYEFESQEHGMIGISKSEIHNAAFPATRENYEKLSAIWPDLEKPPKKEREDRDVRNPKPFTIDEYEYYAPTKAPCLCWVADEDSREPFIEHIARIGDAHFYNALTQWKYAIPLSDGELEQLSKLNKEARNG